MKLKYGNSAGRPIKRSDNVIAPRREVSITQKYEYEANDA
jgi:hypothetical protein